MKKLVLIIVIVYSGLLLQAQELKENALSLKNSTSKEFKQTYKDIKEAAVTEWGEDHRMIVYTINKQSDAFFEMIDAIDKSDYDAKIMLSAMLEWGEHIEAEERFKADWVMVMYTYKKQLKAKNAY